MRETELQYDIENTVSADANLVPVTAASAKLISPNGDIVSTQTADAPMLSTTVAEGTTATLLVLADATGIEVGDGLRISSGGVSYSVTVATIDGNNVVPVVGLPVVPATGSSVYGTTVKAAFGPYDVSRIGPNYRIAWTVETANTTERFAYTASVVRWKWTPVVAAKDVRDILSELNQTRSEQWCQGVADRVDEAIQAKLLSTGRRPWYYLSSGVFFDAARTAIRYELSQRGIAFGGQIYEAQRELRFAFDDKLAQVIQGLQGVLDANDDGKIDAAEAKPTFRTLQVLR